jgi:hypothetical protein
VHVLTKLLNLGSRMYAHAWSLLLVPHICVEYRVSDGHAYEGLTDLARDSILARVALEMPRPGVQDSHLVVGAGPPSSGPGGRMEKLQRADFQLKQLG